MGPGTGLGEGILTKSKFSNCHEVVASEGGHVDFAVRNEEDWKLHQFAMDFVENSDNVENQRGRAKLDRLSTERLCAGPAVPLLYQFLKGQYPDLKSTLEERIAFKDMTSTDIISAGMRKENADPLCKKVIEKFAEIFAVEVGNMALKTIPYGGIYLVGGVTNGILDYLVNEHFFLSVYYKKGRISSVLRRIPLCIVKPEVELGIMGAEECAFRAFQCYSK